MLTAIALVYAAAAARPPGRRQGPQLPSPPRRHRRCAGGMPLPPDEIPMPDPMHLILYQRDDCHLCDLALAVMAAARVPAFESVFIDGDDALEAAYGVRVPVLRDVAGQRELPWPFDAAALRGWLDAPCDGDPPQRAGDR